MVEAQAPTQAELGVLFARAPFSALFPVEIVSEDRGHGLLSLRLTFAPHYAINAEGHYHGGAIAVLVDIAASMVCVAATGRPAPTADLRVDYLASPSKVDLFADAKLWRTGRRLARADVVVRSEQGEVFALGRGAFSVASARPAMFRSLLQTEPLG